MLNEKEKEEFSNETNKSIFSESRLKQLSGQSNIRDIVALDFRKIDDPRVGKITRIENLGRLLSLTSLNLSHQNISTIENLHDLTNLRYLDMSENSIEKVS